MSRKPRSEMHCQYVSPLGRKCRQLRAPGHPSLCQHHSLRPQQALNETCAAQLFSLPAGQAGQIEDFTSAAPVNQFLANLLRMTARGLIARRDAAVLASIAQSLLNGLAARRREILDEQALAEDEPVTFIWDIPRPHRDEEPAPNAEASSDRARYERLTATSAARSETGLPVVQAGQNAEEPPLDPLPAGAYP